MDWRGLRPLQCRAVPKPRIAQIIRSVISAEEYHFVSDRIVGHLRGSAGWGSRLCGNVRPRCAVETPCVIQIACAAESAKHNSLRADRIVGHCKIRARRRRIVWRELDPIRKSERSSRYTRCQGDRNTAADKNCRRRKVSNLSEFHPAGLKALNRCFVKSP